MRSALPPGSTIGILGSGQLGRMLAVAAAQLGFKVHVYGDTSGPAFDVAAASTVGAYQDLGLITEFAEQVDVVTYEFENVPLGAAAAAAAIRPVRPGPRALEVAQDRLIEKQFLSGLGLPVAPFANVDSLGDLEDAIATLGVPAILKTCRFGYDGKGQVRIASAEEPGWALDAIGRAPAVLEGFVAFESEISVLCVRGLDGRTETYDVPLNCHKNGILDTSSVPAPVPPEVCKQAFGMAASIANALDYVGVLAVEMFYLGADKAEPLVINEIAPRVHNSGHWTLDACAISQFENHIRAVAGWPLGCVKRHSDAVMTNLIGEEVENLEALAAEPGACVYIYGKNDPRPGRKMGHVTRLTGTAAR